MTESEEKKVSISFITNGPISVNGKISITYKDDSKIVENVHLCRCGFSKNKPYCDGSHAKNNWKE